MIRWLLWYIPATYTFGHLMYDLDMFMRRPRRRLPKARIG